MIASVLISGSECTELKGVVMLHRAEGNPATFTKYQKHCARPIGFRHALRAVYS
jgi:hypothetical protein